MTGRVDPDALSPERRHAEFQPGFVWLALAVAIFGGFAIGGHLSFVIGFGYPLSASFPALVQAHGHAQLVGWAGLFVMGVSLHFMPRLASIALPHQGWIGGILWLMGIGVFLRVVGQSILPYLAQSAALAPVVWLVGASGVLEEAGILLYLFLLLHTLRGTGAISAQPAFAAVRPHFGMMVAGWLVYASVNLVLLLQMAIHRQAVLHQGWNELAIQGFTDLMLLPVAMAHSVRLFPMFLALSAAFWPVRATAYAYLAGVSLQLIPAVLSLLEFEAGWIAVVAGIGAMTKGGVILWFTWQLDILTRRRPVERPARFLFSGPDRAPTRPGIPDYGEFGRFELLIYSAFLWLVLAAGFEMMNGAAAVAAYPTPFALSAIRHMYLLGFITLLIFGVSLRMLPGFMRKRAVARPSLVEPTIWLGNAAAVFRLLPFVLPPTLLDLYPVIGRFAWGAFGLSGMIGLAAVVCLAVNLWQTARPST